MLDIDKYIGRYIYIHCDKLTVCGILVKCKNKYYLGSGSHGYCSEFTSNEVVEQRIKKNEDDDQPSFHLYLR